MSVAEFRLSKFCQNRRASVFGHVAAMNTRVGFARATVSIVWCLLIASVALGSSDGLQIGSLLNDPLVVRNSANLRLRALCSVSIASNLQSLFQ